MLGDMIGELHGKVTGTRVLPGDDYRYMKIEISWEERGQAFGADVTNMGTIAVFERVPGQLYGTGQGVSMVGTEGAIWNAQGISQMTGGGVATHSVFSLAFQAAGGLERLNHVLVIGEQDVDADGNVTTRLWEWK